MGIWIGLCRLPLFDLPSGQTIQPYFGESRHPQALGLLEITFPARLWQAACLLVVGVREEIIERMMNTWPMCFTTLFFDSVRQSGSTVISTVQYTLNKLLESKLGTEEDRGVLYTYAVCLGMRLKASPVPTFHPLPESFF